MLFWGSTLGLASLLLAWPAFSSALSTIPHYDSYKYLVTLNMGTIAVALVASSWQKSLNRASAPLVVSCFLLMIMSFVVGPMAGDMLNRAEFGGPGYAIVTSIFKISCILAGWLVNQAAKAYGSAATTVRATYLSWMTRVTSMTVVIGTAVGLAGDLIERSQVPGDFFALQSGSTALVVAGASGLILTLLYSAIESLVIRRKIRCQLKEILPALLKVWNKCMPAHAGIIHPMAGKTIEQRAHRTCVELRDAAVHEGGFLEAMDEEEYMLLDKAESLLAGHLEEK